MEMIYFHSRTAIANGLLVNGFLNLILVDIRDEIANFTQQTYYTQPINFTQPY